MNDTAALQLSLQLMKMKPEDLLSLINSAQGDGGEPVVRSTYTRWANGSTAVPAAVKALLRYKLLDLSKEPVVELPRRITVAFVGKGGTGRTSNSMLLTALAETMGIPATYVDPVADVGQSNAYALSVSKTALPSRSVVRAEKGNLRTSISQGCPENGIAFIDCPPRVFLGHSVEPVLEDELMASVDHFVITSDASHEEVRIARKIAAELKKRKASFRVLLCGQRPNVKDIAKYYTALADQEIPTFSNYVFGTGNTFEGRLRRYGRMHDAGELEDDDLALFDTLTELLEEFNVRVEPPNWRALENKSFVEVVRAVADAKGAALPTSSS